MNNGLQSCRHWKAIVPHWWLLSSHIHTVTSQCSTIHVSVLLSYVPEAAEHHNPELLRPLKAKEISVCRVKKKYFCQTTSGEVHMRSKNISVTADLIIHPSVEHQVKVLFHAHYKVILLY